MIRSNLQAILNEKGISIRQLSRDIEYDYETVRRLCNNEMKRYPDDLLYKTCKYLNVSINQLLIMDEEQKESRN